MIPTQNKLFVGGFIILIIVGFIIPKPQRIKEIQKECSSQCFAEKCARKIDVPCNEPKTDFVYQLYCGEHQMKYQLWKQCVETSDYTDSSLSECDSLYGNNSFSLTFITDY